MRNNPPRCNLALVVSAQRKPFFTPLLVQVTMNKKKIRRFLPGSCLYVNNSNQSSVTSSASIPDRTQPHSAVLPVVMNRLALLSGRGRRTRTWLGRRTVADIAVLGGKARAARFADVLPPELLRSVGLEAAALSAYCAEGGDAATLPPDLASQATRWLGPGVAPRCAIERAVRRLGDVVFAPDDPQRLTTGAEYWVQRRDGDGALALHFDLDTGALHDGGAPRSPTLSSVLYLSDASRFMTTGSTAECGRARWCRGR